MNTDRRRLKRATELLVKSVGGIEAAASILEKGSSTVGRWTNKNDDSFINVADLQHLEDVADGPPLVTVELARLAGGVFIPLPQMPGSADQLPMQVMEIIQEMGQFSEQIRNGLGDGHFGREDAESALAELHDVEACVARLRLALQAIAEPVKLEVAA